MVCNDPTAEAWFAETRDLRRSGIAIAAMTRMIPTTMRSSITEKPQVLFLMHVLLEQLKYIGGKRHVEGHPISPRLGPGPGDSPSLRVGVPVRVETGWRRPPGALLGT